MSSTPYTQGYLQYHPPLTLAETASIFGEMIVFRDLLAQSSSKEEELTLLMSKIDDVVNSVVRQCSFDRFEELVHTARDKGELSADELDEYWMSALREYYGKEGVAGGDSPFDSYENTSPFGVMYHTSTMFHFTSILMPLRILLWVRYTIIS